ncbi:MAG: hypothetical protein PHT40_03490 [Patescibacteria group bacterium]|nr:hypothetical protein [Patescibacteria group bacterium]
MSSIYRAIMRQALKIMWQTKFLWFFGLFAAVLETDRVVNLVVDKYPRLFDLSNFLTTLREAYLVDGWKVFWPSFGAFFTNFTLGNGLLLLLFVVLGIFLLWLALVSQAALFSGAYKIYKKQKTSFGALVKIGNAKFWKTLWLNLLTRVSIGVVWFVLGLPFALIFVARGVDWSQSVFIIASFIASIIFALFVYFLFRYALMYMLNDGVSTGTAIKAGWNLFKKNWLVSIEMAIVLFLADVLTVIVLLVGIFVLLLVYAILGAIGLAGLNLIIFVILTLAAILWIIWVAALSSVFRHTTWTILFVRISEGEVLPKIMRLVGSGLLNKQSDVK